MDDFSLIWQIKDPLSYGASVVLAALILRILFALIKAIRVPFDTEPEIGGETPTAVRISYFKAVWQIVRGISPKHSPVGSDYWYTFLIGLFELAVYPVLIACEAWAILGAWMGLKTVAQWGVWANDRSTFNLFLIGNLMVLMAAFFVLLPFVDVPATS